MTLTEDEAVAFWAMVDRTGECWIWRPKWNRWRLPGRGKSEAARRLAWDLSGNSPIHDKQLIRVSCGNGSCLRHLEIRARVDKDKGKMPIETRRKIGASLHVRGEDHGRGKLSVSHARAILQSEEPSADIAKRAGVTRSAICRLRKRKTWKHLRP